MKTRDDDMNRDWIATAKTLSQALQPRIGRARRGFHEHLGRGPGRRGDEARSPIRRIKPRQLGTREGELAAKNERLKRGKGPKREELPST